MAVTPERLQHWRTTAQVQLSASAVWKTVTPLQVAMTSAAIANGGSPMQPTLIKEITAPDLTVVQPYRTKVFSQPITPATSATMTQLMINNVSNVCGQQCKN
jgi:peptidoglycan glycosyltransferase